MDESEIKKIHTMQNDWIESQISRLHEDSVDGWYYRDTPERKMPLAMIPEATTSVLSKFVWWEDFRKKAPNASAYDEPLELADHFTAMMCSMGFEYNEGHGVKRGKWIIHRDDYNDIYWKIDGNIEEMLIEVLVNYLLND